MYCTRSAHWSLVMACVLGLATNCAGFAYGAPGSDSRYRDPWYEFGYSSHNQPLDTNWTDFGYTPVFDRVPFPNTASPAGDGDEILLFSPSCTLHEAHYSVNGVPYVMKPGTKQRLKNDRVWKVEVNSGTGQVMRYTLAPGAYKFRSTGLSMSMGLFATQDRPELTTVAAAIPGGRLVPSIGTPARTATPLIPTYRRAETWLSDQELRKHFDERPAPAITASQWLNTGHAPSPEQFRDKVVLLDFWGSWCGPCVRNLPKVQALYEKYKDRGLMVVGVHSAQGAESVAACLANHSCSFPVAVDTGDTATRYGVEGFPSYFLIDKSGKQTWKFGHEPPHEEQIENLLKW